MSSQAYKESEQRLRRLQQASTELSKYQEEHGTMEGWLTGAEDKMRALQRRAGGDLSSLADQEQETAMFAADVVAHQAELRFLNMQAQRYIDQAKVSSSWNM